jgi:hypothetical protein
MIAPMFFAAATALLMAGLLVEVSLFRALHDDPPSMYQLYALRDRLVRLVIDRAISRDDPYFEAVYQNVNILLKGCRLLSGPDGWRVAQAHGRRLAHEYPFPPHLAHFPPGALPQALEPVLRELRDALEHLIRNHYGIWVFLHEKRRELARLQKEQAKQFLRMMPSVTCQ